MLNKNFVMIGFEEAWEISGVGCRSDMIAKTIMRSKAVGKLVIINCPLSLPSRLRNRVNGCKRVEDTYPLMMKKRGVSIVKLNEKAFMINLTALFPESDNVFSKIDRNLLVKKILWALKQLKLDDYILWISEPRIVDIAKKIPAKIRLFDAVDNLLLHPQLKRFQDKIRRSYEWVNHNADLICIASDSQREMFSSASKLFLLPNGVDPIFLEHKNYLIPNDIASVKKPLVGYVGVLQERIDVNLLKKVIELLPDYSFIFVGKVIAISYFDSLKKYRNVYFLGNRKYTDIPNYLHSFDACIIPHKVSEFTGFMNPLKIYEYLASGKPVISTPVSGTENFRKYIYLAKDDETFSSAIVKAISENSEILEKGRREAVSPHSWHARVESLMAKIDEISY